MESKENGFMEEEGSSGFVQKHLRMMAQTTVGHAVVAVVAHLDPNASLFGGPRYNPCLPGCNYPKWHTIILG